jgi:2-polyprenyl-3-methyl-5-hydroxy-6-metoxy-1,4-benzoquinol methylase
MACPACCGVEIRPFMDYRGCRLARCDACRLVFMDPPPPATVLGELYADPYDGATAGYFKKVEKKMRRSRIRVKKIIGALGRDPKGLGFLDIGCSGGFVAEAARERGFVATGIDPDGAAISYARGHYPANTFHHGFLETIDLPAESFDAVYCSEVIEHSSDVNRFVARLAAVMKPGALVYLTTPDIEHWRRPRDITHWDAFCPPSHCLYFNPENLTRLLARYGLAVTRRSVAFKPGIKLMARRVDGAVLP